MRSQRPGFHDRVASLCRAALAIGGEVQRSIPDATDAWIRRDCESGRRVDARTAGWSERARDIEMSAYQLIATQQPVGADLRAIMGLVRLTEDVARSGDLVAHVARSACFPRSPENFTPRLRTLVVEMAAMAAQLMTEALEAFERTDVARALAVQPRDAELDRLTLELFAAVAEEQLARGPAIDLALLGRFYERLGDHAVEVARSAVFVATGARGAPDAP